MKAVTKEARNGLKFTCLSPETPEEFDKLAGRAGASLDDANDNIWYRGVFPDYWYYLAAKLLAEYGIPRKFKDHPDGKTHSEGDKKGQVIQVSAESDPQYVDRVAAEKGVDPTSFQPLVDELATVVGPSELDKDLKAGEFLIRFDPSIRVRTSGPAGPAKVDLEMAKTLIAQGAKKLKISLNKIEEAIGSKITIVPSTDPDHESKNVIAIANAVKAYKGTIAKGLIA